MLCDSPRTGCNRVPQKITVLVFAAVFAHFSWAADSVPRELPPQEEQEALRRRRSSGSYDLQSRSRGCCRYGCAWSRWASSNLTSAIRGWITEEQGEGILVTFISGDANEAPQALYRVSVSKEGEVMGPPQELKIAAGIDGIRVGRGRGTNLCVGNIHFSPVRSITTRSYLPADLSRITELGGLSSYRARKMRFAFHWVARIDWNLMRKHSI